MVDKEVFDDMLVDKEGGICEAYICESCRKKFDILEKDVLPAPAEELMCEVKYCSNQAEFVYTFAI